MFPVDRLTEMVEGRKIKSSKNMATVVINKKIQINYGAWLRVEEGKDDVSGYVNSYEDFIEMVTKEYPLKSVESFVLTS
ncbi:hypothetical protein QJQ58_15605 [Paenibacillus dendritiformis]|uniref:hypothetical protein n=1 Tax=Paenibacillus dendritiformis TaxID=130049 RepID=UPI00248AC688|nr:hypothetical protein [Paenibacillus dendritiformis]WGU92037.1 hypothetical protein QJQ58_15605 [Paenibacillus dendritiformis]